MRKSLRVRAYGRRQVLIRRLKDCCMIVLMLTLSTHVWAEIKFHDIVSDGTAGIHYHRTESPRETIHDTIKQQPTFIVSRDFPLTPIVGRGTPGVVLFDYDNDGDEDIYVTNGPGTPNSLYTNQLKETGVLTFIDMQKFAGVGAIEQDSTGACAGDIDNDGDMDLLVLGSGEPSRLFENRGNGTFIEITSFSEIGGGDKYSSSCAMGDIDNDGLLDIAVSNTYTNWDNHFGVVVFPFELNEHNQLFKNIGDNQFRDISATSGIQALAGLPSTAPGAAGISWTINLIDYDLDGDVDIIFADDQGGFPPAKSGGVDRGVLHVLQNDGAGMFTDMAVVAGTNITGAYRGLASADFNCDGHLDLFVSNGGDYAGQLLERKKGDYQLGEFASRWFLGTEAGNFMDPGVGNLVATPFGWGAGAGDYDNDGDFDIIYHGGLEISRYVINNPGVILQNQGCSAGFIRDTKTRSTTNHNRRIVMGMALGDLNDDGFLDIVSASNSNIPEFAQEIPYSIEYGSPFDDANFVLNFVPTGNPTESTWSGLELTDGDLSIEINSADNGNNWVKFKLLGTKNIVTQGKVNRNGIGAVVSFQPKGGKTSMQPILAGSTTFSQSSLEANFGLGRNKSGKVDVLWPGGVRNRLYKVKASEKILFPEIPCSYADKNLTRKKYSRCVKKALHQLREADVLNKRQSKRFLRSAIKAYKDEWRQERQHDNKAKSALIR